MFPYQANAGVMSVSFRVGLTQTLVKWGAGASSGSSRLWGSVGRSGGEAAVFYVDHSVAMAGWTGLWYNPRAPPNCLHHSQVRTEVRSGFYITSRSSRDSILSIQDVLAIFQFWKHDTILLSWKMSPFLLWIYFFFFWREVFKIVADWEAGG